MNLKYKRKRYLVYILLGFHLGVNGQNNPILPYKNTNLSTEERVNDLINRMTLQEKILQDQCSY